MPFVPAIIFCLGGRQFGPGRSYHPEEWGLQRNMHWKTEDTFSRDHRRRPSRERWHNLHQRLLFRRPRNKPRHQCVKWVKKCLVILKSEFWLRVEFRRKWRMVWIYDVPSGAEWVQTLLSFELRQNLHEHAKFAKIFFCRMKDTKNVKILKVEKLFWPKKHIVNKTLFQPWVPIGNDSPNNLASFWEICRLLPRLLTTLSTWKSSCPRLTASRWKQTSWLGFQSTAEPLQSVSGTWTWANQSNNALCKQCNFKKLK